MFDVRCFPIFWLLFFLFVQYPQLSFSQATNASNDSGDLLHLLDGSSLHGRLQSIDRKEGIRWGHPLAKSPLQFLPDGLEEIRLKHARLATDGTKLSCRFRFNSGDEVFGNLKALDAENLTIDTRFATGLHVARSAMDSLIFLARTFTVLYEGPTNATGWTMGRGGSMPWQYRDGTFFTEGVGTLGRDFGLPGASSLEFDINWAGQFGMILQLYTQNIDRFDYGGGSYIFYFNPNSVTLQRVSSETGIANLGPSVPLPTGNRRAAMHVEIRANKEESVLALFIDGVLLRKWKDDSGFAAKGTGVLFFCQHEAAPIRLSNIKVSEWDGAFEESRPGDLDKNEDVMRLANRDRVAGNLGVLRDGKIGFTAGQTTLDIPLPRITEIIFNQKKTNPPSTDPWSIRALLTTGEKFTLDLEKWDAQQISGTNHSFGRVAFNAESVRHLQFNLQKMKGGRPVPADEAVPGRQLAPLVNEQQDALLLRNEDFLLGALKKLDPGTGLVWQRDDLITPIEFLPAGVVEIQCHQPSRPSGSNDCQVRLANGGLIDGNLTSLDSEKIVLNTWFAGEVSLPRKSVQMIVPRQQSRALIFNGPTGIEGWTIGKVLAVEDAGQWSYKDGSFLATRAASIARDVGLPDVASIQFDIHWKGTLQMAVALYTTRLEPIALQNKDSEPDFGGFYSLQLGSLGCQLLSVKKNVPIGYLWPQQLSSPSVFSQKNEAHVEIRVDKSRNLIALLIDGVVFKQAVDNEGFAGDGRAMRFVHQGQGSLRLSNLRISEWDGQFDEKYSNSDGQVDLVKLRNNDKVSGETQFLKDRKVVVQERGSKLEIPIERVKQLELAGKKMDLSKNAESNVTAFFRSGGSITFRLDRWDENGIAASDPAFGKVTFNPDVFARIQFKATQ